MLASIYSLAVIQLKCIYQAIMNLKADPKFINIINIA